MCFHENESLIFFFESYKMNICMISFLTKSTKFCQRQRVIIMSVDKSKQNMVYYYPKYIYLGTTHRELEYAKSVIYRSHSVCIKG